MMRFAYVMKVPFAGCWSWSAALAHKYTHTNIRREISKLGACAPLIYEQENKQTNKEAYT